MSKKHFIAAAKQVSEMDAAHRSRVAFAYAAFFAQFCHKFNRQKFLDACGL